jgi:2-hydroxycyclohexanecarboxyl-CoA dehydrogenase
MIEHQSGKIINVISDAARVGQAGNPAYSAAKGGILSFSKALALEEGRHNINVNCVAPGATNTERRIREHQERWEQANDEERRTIEERNEKQLKLYPLRRLGLPEDLANIIVFLASDRAKHITGQCISVNGGFAMV